MAGDQHRVQAEHEELRGPQGVGLGVDLASLPILFLVSDEARYITGVALPVDAGALIK